MKTFKKLLVIAFMFVFINNINAQVTSSQIYDEGNYESSDISDNGTYATISVNGLSGNQGLSKLLEKQTNGSYVILNSYQLTAPTGEVVNSIKSAVQNNGTVTYNDYRYKIISGDSHRRLQKNLLNGSSITVLEYMNDGTAVMKAVDGDLYLVFGVGGDFDPGTLGGLPNLTGGYFVVKIDGTTDQYVWSTFLGNDFVWNSDVEFIVKSGDSDNIYLNKSDGDLIKFSRSTGANLEAVKEGTEGDKYKFDDEGNLHRQVCCEHSLIIYDESDNYNTVLFQTDWEQWNLWNSGMSDWKIIDGILCGLNMGQVFHLSEELIHGFLSHTNSGIDPSTVKNEWVNSNETFSYIIETNNIISIITVEEEEEDESLIPTLNDSDADIIAVLDGYTYDGEEWNEAYHQSTIVFEDGTLPSIGDIPNENWINIPPGTNWLGANPIEESPRQGNDLIFHAGVRKIGTAEHDIIIKIFLKEESDVDGIEAVGEVEESVLSIYPNPVNDVVNISSDLEIEEVQVYDISGKICFQMNLDSDQIDISDLKSGMYFMKILVDGSFITKKFIKK